MEEIKCVHIGQLEGAFEMANRVYSPDGLCPTIRAMQGGGLEPKIIEVEPYDEQNGYIRRDGVVGTITTDGSSPKHNNRIVETTRQVSRPHGFNRGGVKESEIFPAARCSSTEDGNNGIVEGRRVRKLTPRECWRLMGFTDEDFDRASKALNDTFYGGRDKSSSQLYKQAGNSIVVNNLTAILENLF